MPRNSGSQAAVAAPSGGFGAAAALSVAGH
jgi:hypothetical protein